jgi:hypothetical protein
VKALALACILLSASLGVALAAEMPPGEPALETTSGGPVLLRYKFAEGGDFPVRIEIDTLTRIGEGAAAIEVPVAMGYEAEVVIDSVDDEGVADLTMTAAHITLRMDSPDGTETTYDSATDAVAPTPDLYELAALVGTPIRLRVNAVGALLETDTSALEAALAGRGTGAVVAASTRQTMDQLLQSTFVTLSEAPVRAGEDYDAGTVAVETPGAGTVRTATQYRVAAISGDGGQVVLEPASTMTLEPDPDVPATVVLKSADTRAWLLFDVVRGNIARSAGNLSMTVSMTVGAQVVDMEVEVGIRLTTVRP